MNVQQIILYRKKKLLMDTRLTWVLAVWGTLVWRFLFSMKDLWVVSWAPLALSTPDPQDPVLLTLLVSAPVLMIESSELPRSAAEPLSQFWSFCPTCNERDQMQLRTRRSYQDWLSIPSIQSMSLSDAMVKTDTQSVICYSWNSGEKEHVG